MDTTEIIQGVVGTLVAVIAAFVIPFIKSKTTEQQRAALMAVVKTAVAAAEQMKSLVNGEGKKNYVLEFITGMGLKVDAAELDTMIEAAVFELKKAFM